MTSTILFSSACASRSRPQVKVPKPARIGTIENGIASWYGPTYHGRRTASGEIFDMDKLTAAHKKFPFETWVEVTNLRNGKRVIVRITDRGPFVRGRVIDLSRGAARELDMLSTGVERVHLKVIPAPPTLLLNPDYSATDDQVVITARIKGDTSTD